MKTAARALRSLVAGVVGVVGLEGAFLTAGTALLAVGSTYISAAGPWFVTGVMAIVVGLALAIPAREG